MRCNLDAEINDCPFFVQNNLNCTNSDKCSFQECKIIHEAPRKEIKKEKWFEKYYKR